MVGAHPASVAAAASHPQTTQAASRRKGGTNPDGHRPRYWIKESNDRFARVSASAERTHAFRDAVHLRGLHEQLLSGCGSQWSASVSGVHVHGFWAFSSSCSGGFCFWTELQPQNASRFCGRESADLSSFAARHLHALSCLEARRPIVRMGPATLLAFALLFFTALSQHFGIYQISSAWNSYLDLIVKNSLLLIMVEAMASTAERVWAVQMTTLFCTLRWVKGGLRLSAMGAT
jgi:hypothetical protein